MSADGERRPLGLLALETGSSASRNRSATRNGPREQSLGESARWLRGVETVEEQLAGRVKAIHVMDREGDQYALLAALAEADRPFVIRSFQDRRLAGEDEARLRATACAAKVTLRREVPLSPRPHIKGPKGKRHPARRHRIARLSFAATNVELKRTSDARQSRSPWLRLNVIHVFERKPPPGEPAVEWFLLTNLSVDTDEAIAFAVDCYRARWTIEEFFKALKTGLPVRKAATRERPQSAERPRDPCARRVAASPPAPPRTSEEESAGLECADRHAAAGPSRRYQEASSFAAPSARDAMLAVATLGGHIKSNGDPGWLVLGRSMHDLLILEMGWRAREAAEK